jgi:hypothetical protein
MENLVTQTYVVFKEANDMKYAENVACLYGIDDERMLPGKPKNMGLLKRPKHGRKVEMKMILEK